MTHLFVKFFLTHTDGVCGGCAGGRPFGGAGASDSYETISPMGESVNRHVFIALPKSKPNHKPFTVLFSGLTFNKFSVAFFFSSL